jgi:tetratricopeptide (TPR) repeat protein
MWMNIFLKEGSRMKFTGMQIIFALAYLTIPFQAGALDWKALHERAVLTDIKTALNNQKSEPDSLENLYVLGLVYLKFYKIQNAENVFKNMDDIDSSSIEAKWGALECARRKRLGEQAGKGLYAVIESNPEFAPAYISLAYYKYMNFDFNESARLTYAVTKMDPENVDSDNYVRAYALFGGAKGMIAHYGGPLSKMINGGLVSSYLKKAEELDPDSAAALVGMGGYYLLAPPLLGKDLEKAEQYLLKAKEADPLFPDTYVRLAQLYRAKGDNDKYERYLEKALSLDPQNEIGLDVKSRACRFICPSP